MGARPASDAACMFLRMPSSGLVAISWLAVSVPTPAVLVRIWYRRASVGSGRDKAGDLGIERFDMPLVLL